MKLLLALDLRFLNGSDYTWEKPDGTSLPRPVNPMMGLIRSGEAADESASESEEATEQPLTKRGSLASRAREPPKAREPKDPHDFKGFWDPGDLEAIPWDDLSYDTDANFTAKRSFHAAAIFVFYSDELQANHPDFCNQVHAGWQAHFKRPMCAGDLDLMPTVGEGAYSDDEVLWCKETIRYLRSRLDSQGLIDRGLPAAVRTSARSAGRARAAAVEAAVAGAKLPAQVAATTPSARKRIRQDGDATASDSDIEPTRATANRKGKRGSQVHMRVTKKRYLWHFSAYFLA